MRYIFYHYTSHGPIRLEELDAGQTRYGGSVARLRLLFWIAQRGHEVCLTGNVVEGEWRGVRAVSGGEGLARVLTTTSSERSLLVVNDPPGEESWDFVRRLRSEHTRLALWAGVPFGWHWLDRLVRGELDRIVCVSEWHRDIYRYYPGFEKIEVVYSGVDTDLMQAAPAALLTGRVVISTSVPRRTKGFHILLRAWGRVRQTRPDARLRVCGSAVMHDPSARLGRTGVLEADLEAEFPEFFDDMPQSLQAAGIELMGARPLLQVYSDLKSAKMAVVNANWRGSVETFCRAAVEAQICGTPVVGAARGSLNEVVAHGKTGLLVNRESSDVLAEAVLRLLEDETCRRRLSDAGPAWARPLADYAIIAPGWEAIAQRAWSGEPAPARPRQPQDTLRRLGYGRARLWVRERIKSYSQG